jgi:hypothetical protein
LKGHIKDILIGLTVFPMAVIFFLVYVHVISFLDPILSIGIGGLFWIIVLVLLWKLVVIIKDVVVSMFKENKEVDHRGFKKHF